MIPFVKRFVLTSPHKSNKLPQVLVGSNASGKSNLFDALHLLSRLAEVDLRSAFQGLRGSPDDQFTLFPDGQRSDSIRIAVELLKAPSFLSSEGHNLPSMLARVQAEDKQSLIDISRDMANLVPGFHRVKVEKDDARGDYEIVVETVDEHTQPAQVLSDGTLRLLALAAIRNDPQYHGVLCLEEPEK